VPTTWVSVVVFAAASALTLAVTALVGWLLLTSDAIRRSPDGVESPDALFDAQRRLLDDVRHELKTRSRSRGHLELMDAADPPTSRRRVPRHRRTRPHDALIGDIDLLAAVESDSFTMGDVDLDALTRRVASWSPSSRTTTGVEQARQGSSTATVIASCRRGCNWPTTRRSTPRRLGDRDRQRRASSELSCGCAITARESRPPCATASSVASTAARASGRSADRASASPSSTIAKAHGGHCTVADTPGGGATFTIEIPIGTQATLPTPVRAGDVVQQREASG
jgi:hypothetical protein